MKHTDRSLRLEGRARQLLQHCHGAAMVLACQRGAQLVPPVTTQARAGSNPQLMSTKTFLSSV